MLDVTLSRFSAISPGSGAAPGRAGIQGVHPIAVIGTALAAGFIGVAIAAFFAWPGRIAPRLAVGALVAATGVAAVTMGGQL